MKVTWSAPSNIALVKYWGKKAIQLPQNPSISFTLKRSITTLSITATENKIDNQTPAISLSFFFEGLENSKFSNKIIHFLATQIDRFPWLLNHHLEIHSSNTFPHSSGIASSASSMSALCLSVLSLDELISKKKLETKEFFKLASELSRLASGSASRSLYGGLVSWGEALGLEGSSDEFATQFAGAHPIFNDFCDSILIVDDKEKSVSSRAGHALMETHPFRDQRFKVARENLTRLVQSLKAGDIETFIEVVEEEALMLHALMMTSRPSYILLKPQSLWLIDQIKLFRLKNNIPVCFTIDAGPNIHLLYPKSNETAVRAWIECDLSSGLVGKKWIHDEVGSGPEKLEAIK